MRSRGGPKLSDAGILVLVLALVVVVALLVWRSGAESERAEPHAAGFAPGAAAVTEAAVPLAREASDEATSASAEEREVEDEERVAAPAKPEPAPKPVTGVRGRVLDRDDEPVAGALVLLAPESGTLPWPLDARGPAGRFEPLQTRTDAKGRFLVEQAPLGSVRLAVRRDRFAPLDVDELTVVPAEVTDVGDLRFLPAAILSGEVRGELDAPVAGARLYALGELLPGSVDTLGADNGALVGRTDDAGQFEIRSIRHGRWRLLVASDAHPEEVFEGFIDPLDERLDGLVLRLGAGASITGYVTGADDEPPLVVYAVPGRFLENRWNRTRLPDLPETLAGFRSAAVGEQGAFALTGLVPDEPYHLLVRDRDRPLTVEDPFSEPLDVRAGARDVELPYGASATLAFEVIDGVSGAPVESFTFYVYGVWPTRMTDGEGNERERHPGGRVEMKGVRPRGLDPKRPFPDLLESAPCKLSISSLGYDAALLEDVRFTSGQTCNLGRVRLTPTPVLKVRVVDQETDEPIERARVLVRKNAFSRGDRTDEEGRADVSFPLRSTAQVNVRADDYQAFERELSVAVCSRDEPYEVRLLRATGPTSDVATVEVLALDYGREPLSSHVVLRAQVPRPERGGITSLPIDGAGRAVFRDMGATYDYALQPQPRLGHIPPVEPLWERVTSQLGEGTSITLLGHPLERLYGTVLLNGRPLPDARLRVAWGSQSLDELTEEWEHGLEGPAPSSGLAAGRTDRDGRFAFEDVAPGTYSILVDDPATGLRTRRVVQASPTELVLELGDTEISGTVRDEHGRPVEGAPVHVVVEGKWERYDVDIPQLTPLVNVGRGLAPFATTYTGHDGGYRVDGVPPDLKLGVVVRADGLAGARWRVRAERGQRLDEQDVVARPVASLDVRVEHEKSWARFAVLLFSPERPVELGLTWARVGADDVARFGDLDPGEWRVAVVFVDELDRVTSPAYWEELTLNAGEHHETALAR